MWRQKKRRMRVPCERRVQGSEGDTRKMSLRYSELCAMAFDTVAAVKWHVAQLGKKMGDLTRAAR